ncbi:hypothetical protein AQUCO_12100004v1 [Aquilegia coerulea]|uniref:C2H2-type domain-containing protein n=1 Tax=Aquilegia coerulea TaxID=218851 RepID=A0A2G5C353_AQUCA|nr:hypothetical protein AQUCO_12100004v1 [Aquilegia coerulea]
MRYHQRLRMEGIISALLGNTYRELSPLRGHVAVHRDKVEVCVKCRYCYVTSLELIEHKSRVHNGTDRLARYLNLWLVLVRCSYQ